MNLGSQPNFTSVTSHSPSPRDNGLREQNTEVFFFWQQNRECWSVSCGRFSGADGPRWQWPMSLFDDPGQLLECVTLASQHQRFVIIQGRQKQEVNKNSRKMWCEGKRVITKEDNCYAGGTFPLCVIGNISTLCNFINLHSTSWYESQVIHVYFERKMIGAVEIWTRYMDTDKYEHVSVRRNCPQEFKVFINLYGKHKAFKEREISWENCPKKCQKTYLKKKRNMTSAQSHLFCSR